MNVAIDVVIDTHAQIHGITGSSRPTSSGIRITTLAMCLAWVACTP